MLCRTASLILVLPLAGWFVTLSMMPSGAEEPPRPQVDFQGEWQLEDASSKQVSNMTMRYSIEEPIMAMEVTQDGMRMHAIRRMDTGEMIMWTSAMPGMGMRMMVPEDELLDGMTDTGQRNEVNGEACTVWTAKDVEFCITDDGIPVENRFDGGIARLVNIDRSDQDGSSFEPPAGLQIMELPASVLGQTMPVPGELFGLPF